MTCGMSTKAMQARTLDLQEMNEQIFALRQDAKNDCSRISRYVNDQEKGTKPRVNKD